jgi:hypothetical protein
MSRPPRNGYTINSDSELLALDTAILPANTPLINFDRKCWGILTTETILILNTPTLTSYTASRLEGFGYAYGSLSNINDGNLSNGVIALTPTNLFGVITTFASPQILAIIIYQFQLLFIKVLW